jgi:hypothetical protein
VAAMMAGRLRRRYPAEDGWAAAVLMVVLCPLAFAIGAVMLGEQWAGTAEAIRVGNGI